MFSNFKEIWDKVFQYLRKLADSLQIRLRLIPARIQLFPSSSYRRFSVLRHFVLYLFVFLLDTPYPVSLMHQSLSPTVLVFQVSL